MAKVENEKNGLERDGAVCKKSLIAIALTVGLGSLPYERTFAQCTSTTVTSSKDTYCTWATQVGVSGVFHSGTTNGSVRTGSSVTLAIVDTGVYSHSEFSGRILSGYDAIKRLDGNNSRAITDDLNGHGTHVTGIASSAINNAGIVGIAPSAWILPIRVLDQNGTGSWADIVAGVSWATTGYAKSYKTVFNMSVGGTSGSTVVFSNIKQAGSIGVVAAGNEGRPIGSQTFAYQAIQTNAGGHSLIVGAVDKNNVIASFSNTPGNNTALQQQFIVAPGTDSYGKFSSVGIYSTFNDGGYTSMSGTSMATPVVSGAAAVVWGAWPYLTGKQVVDSLLLSAKDLGKAGVDSTYGRGLLDLPKAMTPIGSTCYTTSSCAGVTTPSLNTSPTSFRSTSLSAPAAAGPSVAQSAARIVGYDSIGRHFFFSVSDVLRSSSVSVAGNLNSWMASSEPVTKSTNGAKNGLTLQGDPLTGIQGFSYTQAADYSGYVMAFKGNGVIPFGLAHSGYFANAFVGGDTLKIPYLGLMQAPTGIAYGRELSDGTSWRFGYLAGGSAANQTLVDPLGPQFAPLSSGATLGEVSIRQGALQLIATIGQVQESGTFLGAFSDGVQTSANTWFSSLSSIYSLGGGYSAMATFSRGVSRGDTSDQVAQFRTTTQSYSAGLLKEGIATERDQLALSVAMPSRVSSGGVNLRAGVDVDMETGAPIYGTVPVSLAPQGRERRLELSWSTPLKAGNLGLSAIRRLEPNHDASARPENVLGARLTQSW